MDGFGISESKRGNAIYAAKTPNLDSFKKLSEYKFPPAVWRLAYPWTMGNSSRTYQYGAGRIVYQDTRITKDIEDSNFLKRSSA